VDPKKGIYGVSGNTVNAEKDPSTVSETTHLQLPGTANAREGGERSAPAGSAEASEPPNWKDLGYPPGSPSRDDHLAALERQAQERGRSPNKRRAGAA
jgi:hypothetical protein